MDSHFLFPYRFKLIGWIMFIPSLMIGIAYMYYSDSVEFFDRTVLAIINDELFTKYVFFEMMQNNILDEIAGVLNIVSLMFIAFSKEKEEDEYIQQIRLSSLVWATYVNFGLLLLSIIFIYDMAFFWTLVFNMFTMLVFFIVRFRWKLSQNK